MPFPRTLTRSIAGEIALYSGIGFLAVLMVLTLQNLAQRFEDLAAVGLAWGDAQGLARALLPVVAAYSVPMGFLFGVLVAVGRLSGDSEVTAMRACGLGIGTLLWPAGVLAIGVSALTAVLMIRVEPDSRRQIRAVMANVASRGGILEPGRFRTIGARVLYVQSRDRENRLARILVSDRTNPERPFLIFAERGHFVFDADQLLIRLELEHGDVQFETRDLDRFQRIAFERFDYAIDASQLLDHLRGVRPREMDLATLSESIERAEATTPPPELAGRNPKEYRAHYHRRLALPFAPLVFAALGVPLGLRRARSARSWGVLLCALLAGVYYLLLTLGQFLGESGALPVAAALWIPNVMFGVAGLWLIRRAQRGES